MITFSLTICSPHPYVTSLDSGIIIASFYLRIAYLILNTRNTRQNVKIQKKELVQSSFSRLHEVQRVCRHTIEKVLLIHHEFF